MNLNERSVSLHSITNLYIALFFCQRKAIVSRFFCERTFTTCFKPFAKLMRWVRLWEDGGVSDVNKCLKELQETCFLEYRAKFSISRSQNPSIVVLSRGQNLGKSWSKSFVLENKVVLNFDFRHGANKSGQSGHPFRSYGYL